MKYKITIEKRARKFIEKQPQNQRERLIKAIFRLPYEGDIKPMEGEAGLFRLCVGDYRVLFKKNDEELIVIVIDAGNRGQIYK